MKLLFICTGNICRSPTAERLAEAYAASQQADALFISSAGTGAVIGHAIHPQAARVIEDLGGNSDQFAARQLTPQLAAEADLILTMTKAHRDAVLELAPRKLHQTFTLGEVALLTSLHNARSVKDLAALRSLIGTRSMDIADPIGRSPEIFTAVGEQIADVVPTVVRLCLTPP